MHGERRPFFFGIDRVGLPVILIGSLFGAGAVAAQTGGFGDQDTAIVEPTTVAAYTAAARGIRRCWFNGPAGLALTHEFRAKVAPPSKGGAVQIQIVALAADGKNNRVAYGIAMDQASGGTRITQKNTLFSEAAAMQMKNDVLRWVKGDGTCGIAVSHSSGTAHAIPLPRRHPKRRR